MEEDKDAIAVKAYIVNMENTKYRKLRGIMTYLIIFSIVSGTTILRFYDKISPEVTSFILGVIIGTMLAMLGDIQKEWFNEKEKER